MENDQLVFEVAFVTNGKQSAPNRATLRQALGALEFLQISTRSSVHRYLNPETQVRADFVEYQPEGDLVGLSLEMELPRPLFFALECVPLVVQVARELNLFIEILSPDNEMGVVAPTFELLLEEWQKANRDEVQLVDSENVDSEKAPLPRLGNQALESMWEFLLLRAELARRYGRSRIDVPHLELYRHKKNGRVARVASWDLNSAVALGECDYILMTGAPKPLLDRHLIAFSELREVAKFAFRDLSQPVYHRLFEKPKTFSELREAVAGLNSLSLEEFEPLPFHKVVDVELTPLVG